MQEFIEILSSPSNMPISILLGLLLVYWLFSIVSGLDFDSDFDVDIDIDADLDLDLDADVDASASFGDSASMEIRREDIIRNRKRNLKWWQVFLVYFNFVSLPFMFALTFWVFIWWSLNIITTILLQSKFPEITHLLVLINIIPSLFIMKLLSTPFVGVFRNLNRDGVAALELLGRNGIAISTIKGNRLGSVKLYVNNDPIIIEVKALQESIIKENEEVLIVKESGDKKFYYVKSTIKTIEN